MARKKVQPIPDELTERERKFINARADGLSLLAAWGAAGGELYQGWQKDAGELDRRLKSDVNHVRIAGRVFQVRGKFVTDDMRDEMIAAFYEIATASPLDFFDAEGQIDLEAARQSGKGHLIKKVFVNSDTGKIESVELHSQIEARKAMADVMGFKQQPRQNDADRDAMRDLVEKQIAAVMAEKGVDRDSAVAWMRELPLPEGAKRWLM